MALTELDKVLVDGLLVFGLNKEAIPVIFAGLKTQTDRQEMLNYLAENWKDKTPQIEESDILQKMVEIHNRINQ